QLQRQLLLAGRQLGRQAADLDGVARGREVVVEAGAALGHAGGLGAVQAFEEVADVDLEEAGDVPELGRRDAVGALLVLLDLLKGPPERAAEVALVVAERQPLLADPPSDMPVDRMRSVLALASGHGSQCPLSVTQGLNAPALRRCHGKT